MCTFELIMIIDFNLYNDIREKSVSSRYLTLKDLEYFIKKSKWLYFKIEGASVNNQSIYSTTKGDGDIKVLMWSQMHGNESTSTKSIFDLLNFLNSNHPVSNQVLKHCTLKIIPILNPDGAVAYTRLNANNVDLNRDAQYQSQPESKVLRKVFDYFQPDFCFNLHGQRTIFGTNGHNTPATLSFLSPSVNKESSLNPTREKAMQVISSIFKDLRDDLQNGIGRYDDAFNINCVGDTFQSAGVSTILFEAGHYPNDYQREITRFYFFNALVSALNSIANNEYNNVNVNQYFTIPENKKSFVDVLIKNVKHEVFEDKLGQVCIQFEEILKDNTIHFKPLVVDLSTNIEKHGHLEIDACGNEVLNHSKQVINPTDEIDFVFIKNQKYLIKP